MRGALVDRELEQRGARGEGGARAQRAAGDGGGAEAEGFSAVETAAGHGQLEHDIRSKRTCSFADVGDPAAADERHAGGREQSGQAPRSTTSCALHGVAEARRDGVDQLLELGVLERVEAAAAVADRVVMVLAAGVGGLVAGGAVDVDAADEPEPREHVDRAVHAREADAALLVAQPVVDRLGAEAALLARQQPQHLLARTARAVPRAGQLALRVGLPVGLGHGRSLARMKTRINFSKLLDR